MNHCVYNVNYHIVFCPKFRHQIIVGNVENEVKNVFSQIANQYEIELLALETMSNHVHLFVSAKPTIAPTDIVRMFKSISAIHIFKTFPLLKKKRFWATGLWSRGYYIGTAGTVSSETIRRYIELQKQK